MIIDSSVIVSIVMIEPERDAFIRLLAGQSVLRISSATFSEIFVVLANKLRDDPEDRERCEREFESILENYGVVVDPFTIFQAQRSRVAYRLFGRGSGHPAKLNFGDCFTYALAAETDEPILCKGDDFVHTDRQVVRA